MGDRPGHPVRSPTNRKEAIMASPPKSGKSGPGPGIMTIAVVVLAYYADRAWVTVFLGVLVMYAIAKDWRDRK